jgi:hypothetical protein
VRRYSVIQVDASLLATHRPPGHCRDKAEAYLKGKDAESEEAQEHANNSSLALYA